MNCRERERERERERVSLSHMCDTAVLTTATVMSPGDGIKVVDINKHCQLTEGITT